MKQILPVILLFFICTVCINKNAAAQEPAVTKAKVDTAEEITIVCSFPPIEAGFSGGDSAWQRFVTRHLVYPKNAIKNKIQGIVTVQFLVSKDGTVSHVEALNGPEELKQSAIAVVKKSRTWYPAVQRGRNVDECKEVDIVFKLPTE
jgi:periplasmic protein TonB